MEKKEVLINTKLHLATSKKLISAVERGLTDLDVSNEQRQALAQKLKQNIYPFSAAKSLVQMEYYRNMMVGDDGTILNESTFIKKIADTGEIFNKKYLTAEFENAYYSTLMADKWERFSDDDWLQYSTVGDNNVRREHKILDKFTAPKNHPIWHKIYPPNGWGCRCTVIPGTQNYQNKITSQEVGFIMKPILKNTTFEHNVGISKVIFKDNHPYFVKSNGKETELSWKNYGLKSVSDIQSQNEIQKLTYTTKDEYLNWWNENKNNRDDIICKDILGEKIRLQGGESKHRFKKHILHEFDKKKSENRYKYATESIKILSSPDEIWYSKLEDRKIYLKYYSDKIIKLVINDNNDAESIYVLDDKKYSGAIGKARKGVLLYKK